MKTDLSASGIIIARTGGLWLSHWGMIAFILVLLIWNVATSGYAGYLAATVFSVFLLNGLFWQHYNERAFVIDKTTSHFEVVTLRFNRIIKKAAYNLETLVSFDLDKHWLNTTDVRIVAVMSDGTRIPLLECFADYPFGRLAERMNAQLNEIKKTGTPKADHV